MRLTNYLLPWIIPPLGAGLIRLIRLTMRIDGAGRTTWRENDGSDKGIIFAFWHNRLLLMPFAVRNRKVTALVSQHRDGELISRTVAYLGIGSVRGSSTRGGGAAMRQMIELLGEGKDIAITPDGPRGPRYRVQPGVIQLARLSGRPIYPLAFASDRFRSFKSWDRFQMPKLFSRGLFVWGEPFEVDPSDDTEEKRKELEEVLKEITSRGDSRFLRKKEAGECPSPIEER